MEPGAVRDAIRKYLRSRRGEAPVREIVAGVKADLGHSVAASSVRSYLRLNAGTLFERPRRGHYRLISK